MPRHSHKNDTKGRSKDRGEVFGMSTSYKHFLNSPSTLVVDSLTGLCSLNPHLSLDAENKVVHLASYDRSKVSLMCGGGSGHEPAHAGYVGDGMLTAAVCGNIFASPSVSQVRRAIDLVDNEKGTLIIVKNYTGDVLNFGLAKEQHAALYPSKSDRLKFVIVGDDVAVGKTQGSIVGRRGLAGTILVYKIAGALAKRGANLDEVFRVAESVASNVVTIGVGLEHCHVPGTALPESHLAQDEIEIGMGIHNESGHRRLSPVPPLRQLIPQLLDMLMSTTDPERSFLPFQGRDKDHVVLLVNNLGGLSELELSGIVAETRTALDMRGTVIERLLAGTFMTSLNMPGFSLTLLLLPNDKDIPSRIPSAFILSLLDDPCDASGWNKSSKSVPGPLLRSPAAPAAPQERSAGSLRASDPAAFVSAIACACKHLIAVEAEITRMDAIVGDGDCGTTLKRGAEAVLLEIAKGNISGEDVTGAVLTVARVAEQAMGGTSGALYSIFFSALAQCFSTTNEATIAATTWSRALSTALARLYTYTRARPPSRTLVDPLAALVSAVPRGLAVAVREAALAAENTARVQATAGRSAYVDRTRLEKDAVPDPGAWGVKVILEGLLAGFS